MRLMKQALIIAAVPMLMSAATRPGPQAIAPKLTPRLRSLLSNEMVSVRSAVHGMLDAMVSGDDPTVAKLAQKVYDSFIMEKSMTPQDRKDLEAALPKDFVAIDESFHATAGKLAAAAKAHDRAREQILFDRMIAACASCHSRFASDVFTGFTRK